MKLLARIACWFTGHLQGPAIGRGTLIIVWRCPRCEGLLMTHQWYGGCLPVGDKTLHELRATPWFFWRHAPHD